MVVGDRELTAVGHIPPGDGVARRRRFAARPDLVGAARSFISTLPLSGSAAETAALLVSELATNAVKHAGTDFEVCVKVDRAVRVQVRDFSSHAPVLRAERLAAENGRGLQILDALASAWGWQSLGRAGKIIWFELPL
jgi:anti-sigma regulatory factor (Ser/Thr protein kinase)